MRIERVHVDGFGIFRDLSLGPVPPGLAVIHGDNEAGKTTLLAFLRHVLFGFPDGRSKENQYPPLRGGAHGGRIAVVCRSEERYVIERRPGRGGGHVTVTLPGGGTGDEAVLRQLMGFATRDLFRNIFAFSLAELQQFESLDDEAVKAAIYGAGMGAGNVSLAEIDRDLEKAMGGVFRPGGKNPEINRIFRELAEVRKKLKERSQNIARFDTLHEQLAVSEKRIEELQAEERAAAGRSAGAQQFLDAWGDWIHLRNAERELAELPEIESFPEDGLGRLERIEGKLADLADQVRELEDDLQDCGQKRDALSIDESVLQHAGEILDLQKRREHYDSAVRDIPLRSRDLEAAEEQVAEDLRNLGPEWDVGKVAAFSMPIAERDVIRSHHRAIQELEYAARDAQGRAETAARTRDKAAKELEAAEESLAATPEPAEKDYPVVADRRNALRRLVVLIHRQAGHKMNTEHLEERASDLETQRKQLHGELQRVEGGLPWWPAWACAAAGALAGGLTVALSGWLPGLVIAVVAAGGSCALLLLRRQRSNRISREVRPRLEDADTRAVRLAERKAQEAKNLADTGGEIERLCGELSVDVASDEASVNALIEETEAELEKHRRWTTAREKREEAAKHANIAREEHDEAKRRADAAGAALTEAKEEWAGWLASAGLRADLTPDGALEMAAKIDRCRQRQKSAGDLRERISEMQETVREYRSEVARIAECCASALRDGEDAGTAADHLANRLQTARGDMSRRKNLEERLHDLERKLKLLRTRREGAEREKGELLGSGGAADAEEFRRRARLWGRRNELDREINQRNLALERVAGSKEHLETLKAKLDETTPDQQEAMKREADGEVAQLRDALVEAIDERGRLREQLRSVEAEQSCGELRLEEERLLAGLRDHARTWSVYAIARALLRQARERYERERQPGVIRDASGFFARITGRRYTQILAPPGESTLDVLGAGEQRKHVGELSRGTQEQLYFAVRLGLIREFSARQEPLPVVADDILVNFDPGRARAAADTILELAGTHQVLLFTCHPETCGLIREAAPGTPFFDLRDGCLVGQRVGDKGAPTDYGFGA